jgi:hypothetical protein
VRVDPGEWRRLDLRVHALTQGVPLHDVWCVDLPGGPPGVTLPELQKLLTEGRLVRGPVVRFLFALRGWLGRVFGWDRERAPTDSHGPDFFRARLTDEDRRSSLVPAGAPDGLFRALYLFPRESASEVANRTVHAVSSFALAERPGGYRLYWAIYVRPVGRLTRWYMALIDPFRRWLIYPSLMRAVRAAWERDFLRG